MIFCFHDIFLTRPRIYPCITDSGLTMMILQRVPPPPPKLSFIVKFIRFSLWTIHYRIDTLRFLRILVIPARRYGEKEEGKQKSWNTLRRVANANCRGPLTAGSKSLTALVCLSQTTNLQVVRVGGTCESGAGSKNKPRY